MSVPEKLYDFMSGPAYGDQFMGESWETWRIVARMLDGDSALLDAEQQALAKSIIGAQSLPTDRVQEFFAVAGRRSGKSRFASMCAVHAIAQDYRSRLAPGEFATVPIVACDKRQAQTIFGYCEADVEGWDVLRAEVTRKTANTIEFSHRTRLEVFTSSFRSIRGITSPLAIIDEAAFMRSDDSATPDLELYRAILPALATLNGRLIAISSPHRKLGLLYSKYRDHFGRAA